MKTVFWTFLILITAALCRADYDVTGLSLFREGDNTVAKAITSGPTRIKTLELTKPDRLIIDLLGGVHRLKAGELPALPPGIVVEVRTAQFQAKPEPITRIVLVLAEPVGEVIVENGPRSGKVIIPTPGYPEFETWSIGMQTPDKIIEPELETVETAKAETVDTSEKTAAVTDLPDSLVDIVSLDDSTGSRTTFIRPLVEYNGREFRDPFVTAEPHQEQRFGEEAIPAVEGMILVGIVKDQTEEFLGVLQDRNGWGYILGEGDSVIDGNVGVVTDSTVRFDIMEFGVTRPITLELPKEALGK